MHTKHPLKISQKTERLQFKYAVQLSDMYTVFGYLGTPRGDIRVVGGYTINHNHYSFQTAILQTSNLNFKLLKALNIIQRRRVLETRLHNDDTKGEFTCFILRVKRFKASNYHADTDRNSMISHSVSQATERFYNISTRQSDKE